MISTQYTLVQNELNTVFDIMRAADFPSCNVAWLNSTMKESRVHARASRAARELDLEIEREMRREDRRDRERGRWF
jgi:hypothetical protein